MPSSYVFAEHRCHGVFRNVADDAIDRLTVLEENQARDSRNLVLAGKARIFVGIQFDELRLAGVRRCNLFDNRTEHAARPAPWRPKVDQHRLGILQHLTVKVRLRNIW